MQLAPSLNTNDPDKNPTAADPTNAELIDADTTQTGSSSVIGAQTSRGTAVLGAKPSSNTKTEVNNEI